MKALLGAFNQEKALVGAFSVIVKIYRETNGSCAAQLELPDDQPEIDNDQLTAASLHTTRNDILKLDG